jgi:hypothetical protein
VTPKSQGGKSHSGIPGSKAACAYPGRYRGLPRPSSALKPSHSPDGVGVVGPFGGVCLAFGENLFVSCAFFACAWCHRELHVCSVHPSLCIIAGAELHLFLNDVFYVAEFF